MKHLLIKSICSTIANSSIWYCSMELKFCVRYFLIFLLDNDTILILLGAKVVGEGENEEERTEKRNRE